MDKTTTKGNSMRKKAIDIQPGDCITWRQGLNLLVMEVEDIKVNSNRYDKNNLSLIHI